MRSSQIQHLVIRYNGAGWNLEDPMVQHREGEERKGCVAFGKIGKRLGKRRIEYIRMQNKKGEKIYAYFVMSSSSGRIFYKAEILNAYWHLPSSKIRFIPEYYKEIDIMNQISSWILVKKLRKIEPFKRDQFVTITRKSDIIDALNYSMAGLFVVEARED